MDLRLPFGTGAYTSLSQVARVRTESWAARELYCLQCDTDRLEAYRANVAVHDYHCPSCDANYQLKSKAGPIGVRVANSAYAKKMEAIRVGTVPNYVFLSYDRNAESVQAAFAIPGGYFSPQVIEPRRPLSATARRAGWIGSNILLGHIASIARVHVVEDSVAVNPAVARAHWKRLSFVQTLKPDSRGWLNDIWNEIQDLRKNEFTLGQLYGSESRLRSLHPTNAHVQAKIRQQVQLLRDRGFLTFLGGGRYRIRPGPWRSPDL